MMTKGRLEEIVSESNEHPECNGCIDCAIAVLARARSELAYALRECLDMMRMQERRHSGEFHLSAAAFMPMWDKARDDALSLLARFEVKT